LFARLDVVHLEKRGRFGRLFGRRVSAMANDDRQGAEADPIIDRRIDCRNSRGHFIQTLEYCDVLSRRRVGENQRADRDATPKAAHHRLVTGQA
jgi:hypothetical protein